MINLSPAYEPILIKGLKVHPENPFLFDFILDTGSSQVPQSLKQESEKLIKYFLTAMTVPEKDLWVNLSPYEKNRMIASNLAQTVMGRDMLAQDYILKQLTASLIYPERSLGKMFWDEVYTKARELYGTTQVPVDTFNKVWIVADRADVYEHGNAAYVVGAHLKVMLEEDYLALNKNSVNLNKADQSHTIASNIVRAIILPEIEKEVNSGQNFASLRQMFYSMILASWYKMALKHAILTQLYGNQSKVRVGVNQADPAINQEIFNRYLRAYKKGVFNYIKEDVDEISRQPEPRKYFSGGTNFSMLAEGGILNRISDIDLIPPGDSLAASGKLWDAAITVDPAQAAQKDQDAALIAQKPRTLVWFAKQENNHGTPEIRYSRRKYLTAWAAQKKILLRGIKEDRPYVLLKPSVIAQAFNGDIKIALDDDVGLVPEIYKAYISKDRLKREFPKNGARIFDYLMSNGYFQEKSGKKGHPFKIDGKKYEAQRVSLRLKFSDEADRVIAMLEMAYKCQKVVLSGNMVEMAAGFKAKADSLPEWLNQRLEVSVKAGEFYIVWVDGLLYVSFNHDDFLKGNLRLSLLGGGIHWKEGRIPQGLKDIDKTIHTKKEEPAEDARFVVQGAHLQEVLANLEDYIEEDTRHELIEELDGEQGAFTLEEVEEWLSLNKKSDEAMLAEDMDVTKEQWEQLAGKINDWQAEDIIFSIIIRKYLMARTGSKIFSDPDVARLNKKIDEIPGEKVFLRAVLNIHAQLRHRRVIFARILNDVADHIRFNPFKKQDFDQVNGDLIKLIGDIKSGISILSNAVNREEGDRWDGLKKEMDTVEHGLPDAAMRVALTPDGPDRTRIEIFIPGGELSDAKALEAIRKIRGVVSDFAMASIGQGRRRLTFSIGERLDKVKTYLDFMPWEKYSMGGVVIGVLLLSPAIFLPQVPESVKTGVSAMAGVVLDAVIVLVMLNEHGKSRFMENHDYYVKVLESYYENGSFSNGHSSPEVMEFYRRNYENFLKNLDDHQEEETLDLLAGTLAPDVIKDLNKQGRFGDRLLLASRHWDREKSEFMQTHRIYFDALVSGPGDKDPKEWAKFVKEAMESYDHDTWEFIHFLSYAEREKIAELLSEQLPDAEKKKILKSREGAEGSIKWLMYDDLRLKRAKVLVNNLQKSGDSAMNVQPAENGGIDFNAGNMQMGIQKDSQGMEMRFDPDMIQRIKAEGFDGLEFNIRSILPIANLPIKG